ncbi:hypothetical protein V8E51_013950 [Hyaloscypha variabilis]
MIRAYGEKLTCLDGMTGGPVLVFEICTSETQTLPGVPREPCDLISSWQNAEYIWGHRNKFENISRASNFPWIRNGIIHPSQPLTESSNWHWTPETNPNFPQLLAQMKESFPKGISPSTKVRIGTITVNPLCPNSTQEGQKAMRRVSRSSLYPINTSDPSWIRSMQFDLQVSPRYVAAGASFIWRRIPGRTKKQCIMETDNIIYDSDLSDAWGIQACLCTGVLRRVALREVVAECIEPYMADRLRKPPGWESIQVDLISALRGYGLAMWMESLSDEKQAHVSTVIMEILKQLQYTGVDDDNKFRIGWIHRDSGFKCLKIACTGANSWIKILSDSSDIATFACVTKDCFETTLRTRRCRGALPQSLSLKPIQLCTKVSLVLENCNSEPHPESASIKDGETYWIGREDLLLLATVQLATGAASTNVLKIKRSSIPHTVFKRSNYRSTIRETNDEGAMECMVTDTANERPPMSPGAGSSLPLRHP